MIFTSWKILVLTCHRWDKKKLIFNKVTDLIIIKYFRMLNENTKCTGGVGVDIKESICGRYYY